MQQPNFPLNWNLDSLLPHPKESEFTEVFDRFRDLLTKMVEISSELKSPSDDVQTVAKYKNFFIRLEEIERLQGDLVAFIGCHAAADAENKLFQQLEAKLSSLSPKREEIHTNFEFALKETDEDSLNRFIQSTADFQKIAFFIEESRQAAQLRLPKDQELLASELDVDGLHAWGRLYDRLSGSLRIEIMERGQIIKKSPSQLELDHEDRSVRQNHFFAGNLAWTSISDSCAEALNHIAGTRLTKYRRLGLEDHLVVPLKENRLSRASLNAMWSAISARKASLVRYIEKKAELLGLEKPAWYDLDAPLPQAKMLSSSGRIPYNNACQLVISTFHGFSKELGEFAETALKEGWVEVEDRAGKRQGGFCTGFPSKQQSRIFMTYTGTRDGISTLAHELGHAYHSWVLKDEPLFLQEYPMNLAETASTFAEAILAEKQLQSTECNITRLTILDRMISDSISFLMNIHARFLFENEFHLERTQGEVSSERLTELMLQSQKTAFSNALSDDGWNPQFWISKLHFYISELPFYNFPYTFGYLLSNGIYALAEEWGDEFPQKYRSFLKATGYLSAEDAVQSTLGYDITQENFWNKSLDLIDRRVETFLELSSQIA